MKKALALVFVLALQAHAASAPDIQAVLAAGGSVTVGKEFATYEINSFLATGTGRVTVNCSGFPLYEAQAFLSRGAKLLVDNTYQNWEIKSLVARGKKRVTVAGEGFQPYELKVWAKLGATVVEPLPEQGSTSFEMMAALRAGGSVTCDNKLQAYEISTLLAAARERVTVKAKGFAPYEVATFLSQGAKIEVDRAFPAHDVWGFCSQGKERVTVSADGFESFEINGFASQGARIQYERAQAGKTAAHMTSLHGQ